MVEINHYKIAPTFLFKGTEKRSFFTQVEVDAAWEDGWYGPRSFANSLPLLSTVEWDSKDALLDAVDKDSRYKELKINKRKNRDNMLLELLEFEEEHSITTNPRMGE